MKKFKEIIDLRTGKITKIPLEEVLEELRKDIGDELFFQLSREERELIAMTEGIFDYSETWWGRLLIKLKLRKPFFDRVLKRIQERK